MSKRIPSYEVGQRFVFAVGDKVVCNGYPGTVSKVCDGQIAGMVEVDLARGTVCVGATYPDVYPAPVLSCDMVEGCAGGITHVDNKGYVYCGTHGAQRKSSGVSCRRLTKAESTKLQSGETIRYAR